jgi:hypothetical protein
MPIDALEEPVCYDVAGRPRGTSRFKTAIFIASETAGYYVWRYTRCASIAAVGPIPKLLLSSGETMGLSFSLVRGYMCFLLPIFPT